MYIGNKSLGKFIFYFVLVSCLALEIQTFFINTNFVILIIHLLQIFFGFLNEIRYLQIAFRKLIQPAIYIMKKNAMTYIFSTSDKAVYFSKKLQ